MNRGLYYVQQLSKASKHVCIFFSNKVVFLPQLQGVNPNYSSRAVAKGLLRMIFCGKLF